MLVSSGNLQIVDRSLLNSRFNIDRDMGIQLRHHSNLSDNFIVREIVSLHKEKEEMLPQVILEVINIQDD